MFAVQIFTFQAESSSFSSADGELIAVPYTVTQQQLADAYFAGVSGDRIVIMKLANSDVFAYDNGAEATGYWYSPANGIQCWGQSIIIQGGRDSIASGVASIYVANN